MSSITNNNLSKLWIRMKSYINARLEGLDSTVESIVVDAVANAGYMKMELLWENASPTAEFAEQTLVIDWQSYDAIYIEYRYINTSAASNSVIKFCHKGSVQGQMDYTYLTSSGAAKVAERNFTLQDSGILFTASWWGASNAAASTYTTYCVPSIIYGLKVVA